MYLAGWQAGALRRWDEYLAAAWCIVVLCMSSRGWGYRCIIHSVMERQGARWLALSMSYLVHLKYGGLLKSLSGQFIYSCDRGLYSCVYWKSVFFVIWGWTQYFVEWNENTWSWAHTLLKYILRLLILTKNLTSLAGNHKQLTHKKTGLVVPDGMRWHPTLFKSPAPSTHQVPERVNMLICYHNTAALHWRHA